MKGISEKQAGHILNPLIKSLEAMPSPKEATARVAVLFVNEFLGATRYLEPDRKWSIPDDLRTRARACTHIDEAHDVADRIERALKFQSSAMGFVDAVGDMSIFFTRIVAERIREMTKYVREGHDASARLCIAGLVHVIGGAYISTLIDPPAFLRRRVFFGLFSVNNSKARRLAMANQMHRVGMQLACDDICKILEKVLNCKAGEHDAADKHEPSCPGPASGCACGVPPCRV